jgi:hypothetical protein
MATARKTARKTPATRKAPATRKTTARPAAGTGAPAPKSPDAGTSAAAGTKGKAAKAGKPAKADKKADKMAKPKLVRDSFKLPKSELALLDELKARAARLGQPAKKSEVLRAGVQALAALGDAAFLATVTAIGPRQAARNAPKAT